MDEMGQPSDMLSFDAVVENAERPDSRYFVTSRTFSKGAAFRDGQLMPEAAAVL